MNYLVKQGNIMAEHCSYILFCCKLLKFWQDRSSLLNVLPILNFTNYTHTVHLWCILLINLVTYSTCCTLIVGASCLWTTTRLRLVSKGTHGTYPTDNFLQTCKVRPR